MNVSPESLKITIDTIQDLYSVVKTMKSYSAVNIRQYEQAVDSLGEYTRTVEMGFHILLRERWFAGESLSLYLKRRTHHSQSKLGAIVFGSDKGLCGPFNEKISQYFSDSLVQFNDYKKIVIATVGSRLLSLLKVSKSQIKENFLLPTSAVTIGETVKDILYMIEHWQSKKQINQIILFYNQPTCGFSYRPTQQQLLPLNPDWLVSLEQKQWSNNRLPVFTIEWQELFAELISQYLFTYLYRVLASSLASENASRLVAMQSAQKNIEERLEELETQYRQLRQSAITSELLDVLAGFEALKKDS